MQLTTVARARVDRVVKQGETRTVSAHMKTSSTRIIVAVIGVIALILGLGACSSGDSQFVGVWEIESMDAGAAGTLSGDTLPDELKITLTLNKDGSASMDGGGQNQTGTWKSSNNTVTLTAGDSSDETIDLVLADGKLSGSVEGMTLTFIKK